MAQCRHDWSKPPGDRPDITLRIGRMTVVRATSTYSRAPVEHDYKVVTGDDTVMIWTGPGRSRARAAKMAAADARVAWTVAASVLRWPEAEIPAGHLHTFAPATLGPIIDMRSDSLALGPVLLKRMGGPAPEWTDADLAAIARDALLAAANRARLPGPGGGVALRFGQDRNRERNDPAARITTRLSSYDEARFERHGLMSCYHDVTGPLRTAAIALSVAQTLSRYADEEGPPANFRIPDPGESATLAAAYAADLRAGSQARTDRVCAFMRSVGLHDESRAFADAYG